MEDQLVTFDTAVLAKEKGFKSGHHKTAYGELGSLMYDEDGYSPEVYILAPTQSLLQTWLRNVHNINIGLTYFENSIGSWWSWRIHYHSTYGQEKTYEEALEVSLQQGLILIK
jgi:hypothetical protein